MTTATARVQAIRQLAGLQADEGPDGKCGFAWNMRLLQSTRTLPEPARGILLSVMAPVQTQSDTVIGHFRIHFDSTGVDAPALLDSANNRIPGTALAYVDSVGKIFNEVWDVEINQVGFDPPPLSATSPFYDIYVLELGTLYYGQTMWIEPAINIGQTPLRYFSYIEIDNDFRGFKTSGMAGLRVTAAHEFNHSIQLGAYGLWDADLYVYEMTSTWMEDVVYTQINDYYQYLNNFFGEFKNGVSFYTSQYGGYERCVWAFYLAKRFGQSTVPSVWKLMAREPFFDATGEVLASHGSSWPQAFAEFSLWNYFTGDRADTSRSYSEAPFYPRFQSQQQTTFVGSTSMVGGTEHALALSLFDFAVNGDTITAIMTNIDTAGARVRSSEGQTVTFMLSKTDPAMPYQTFADGLRMGTQVADPGLWRSRFLRKSLASDVPRKITDPWPNPYRLESGDALFLPMDLYPGDRAQVVVLTSSLDRKLDLQLPVVDSQGWRGVSVPASALRGHVGTGMYFVVAKAGDLEYRWKVGMIR